MKATKEAMRGKGGECMDPSKRIFHRKTAASEVEPPYIHNGEIYTCRNWTSPEASPMTSAGELVKELDSIAGILENLSKESGYSPAEKRMWRALSERARSALSRHEKEGRG